MARPDHTVTDSFLLQADGLMKAWSELSELGKYLDRAEPLNRARALLLVADLADRSAACVKDVTSLLGAK